MSTARGPLPWLVRLTTVAGLGLDAAVHLVLAPSQPPAGPAGGLSQVTLFEAEGAVAILAAVLVLLTGRRAAYALAVLVAASALGAVLLYRYVDVGAIGPLPDMYEPAWYPTKVVTTLAEAVTLVAATTGLLLPGRPGPATAGRPTVVNRPRSS